MKSSRYKPLLVAATLLGAPLAHAAVPPLEPLNVEARYNVAFNGMTLGRIRIGYHETAFGYTISIDSETHGVMAITGGSEHSRISADGTVQDGQYTPKHYDSQGDKDHPRHITLSFDAQGRLLDRTRTPMDDPKWRSVVPLEELTGTIDPASAFFIVRKQLHDAMESGQRDVTTRTYDGIRLAEMNFHVVSPADLTIMGKSKHAINLVIARKPIDGYTPKEKKKFAAGDPTIHLYMSADGRFFPLKAEADVKWGLLSAELTELK